jgi:hypothetical protein
MGKFYLMKLSLSFIFITSSFFALAQSIPNAGFENWTECPSAAEPIPFQTSNAISYLLSGSLSVERSTDAHGGNYAAYAHADASQEMQGFFTLGQDFNTGEITPLPFTGTPDSISFWAQHTISDLDYGTVIFTLYQDMTEVGYGLVTFNGSTSGYTYYSSPVNIGAGATPNGMTFGVSSGGDPSLNGELYIDDIHLIYNTGTGDDIPGGDFENWNITSAQCLDGWNTTNGFTLPYLSVEQGEPHSGNHSARITNQPTNFGGGSLGYILLGNPETDFCNESSIAMANGQAATSVSGFYQYTAGNANEMATLFLHYSATNDFGGCDSIYEYYEYLPATTGWTTFSFSVPSNVIDQWQTVQAPQYITIGLVSTVVNDETEPNGDPNSVLLVDDLEIAYTTVSVAESSPTSLAVYPNPANDLLHIQLPSYTQANIQLMDALGQTVISTNTFGVNATLSTGELPSGIYMLRINDGHSISSQQVLVQH